MRQYKDKTELIHTIQDTMQKYLQEFETIPENLKDIRSEESDRTPAENLAYQLGWVNLLLQWEKDEKQGKEVQTPAEGYKWNNLGSLYQSFYEQYGKLPLKEQKQMLNDTVSKVCDWINHLSDTELFTPEQRNWATTKAKWPIWKWIHINTVAPFTNFRTKIRKWKKVNL